MTSKRCSGSDRKTYRLRPSSAGLSLFMPEKRRSSVFDVFIRVSDDLLLFRFCSNDLRKQNVAHVMPISNKFQLVTFFFSSRRRHTRLTCDWSSDVCSSDLDVVVGQPDAIAVASSSKTDVSCNGGSDGSITLGTVTGGTPAYVYSWTTSDGAIPSGQENNKDLTGLTAGTYHYSVTDQHNCTAATGDVLVTEPDAIAVATSSKTDVSCNGGSDGSITLGTVTGGTPAYVYSWTTSDGAIPSGQENNKDLTGLTAGTYHYSVTDQHNCTAATGDVLVTEPDAIAVATSSKTDVSCNGGSDGSITLGTVSGGTPAYVYSWTTADGSIPSIQENNKDLTGLTAGTYHYSVTDQHNCTAATGDVLVTEPDAIAVATSSKTDVSCYGGSDGSINRGTVTGGTPAYVYSWTTADGSIPSGQENNKDLTGLTAGTYHYSVTDQHNCTAATGDVVVGQPDAIAVASSSKTDVSCNGGSDGSITLGTVTGGTPAYVYSWTTSDGAIPSGQERSEERRVGKE